MPIARGRSLLVLAVALAALFGPRPPARAFDAQSGMLLQEFPMPGAVNSSAALVGDTLFVGSGDSESGAGSGVHALRPM